MTRAMVTCSAYNQSMPRTCISIIHLDIWIPFPCSSRQSSCLQTLNDSSDPTSVKSIRSTGTSTSRAFTSYSPRSTCSASASRCTCGETDGTPGSWRTARSRSFGSHHARAWDIRCPWRAPRDQRYMATRSREDGIGCYQDNLVSAL